MHLLGVQVRKYYLINVSLICLIFSKETCIVGRREYLQLHESALFLCFTPLCTSCFETPSTCLFKVAGLYLCQGALRVGTLSTTLVRNLIFICLASRSVFVILSILYTGVNQTKRPQWLVYTICKYGLSKNAQQIPAVHSIFQHITVYTRRLQFI